MTSRSEQCTLERDIPRAQPGYLTVYGVRPDPGACELDFTYMEHTDRWAYDDYVALVSHPENKNTKWQSGYEEGANCGRCIKVRCSCNQGKKRVDGRHPCQGHRGKARETILMVGDKCPRSLPIDTDGTVIKSCYSMTDLDASKHGWGTITGWEEGNRFKATWKFVPCPIKEEYTKIGFLSDMNKWYFSVTVVDHMYQITHIYIKFGDDEQRYLLAFDREAHFWVYRGRGICLPIKQTINEEKVKFNRWMRQSGPLRKFELDITLEIWNNQGDFATAHFEDYANMKKFSRGSYFPLDRKL